MKIVHITHHFGPGSTPSLVRYLHESLKKKQERSVWIGLSNPHDISLGSDEYSLGLKSARDPRAIYHLRKALKRELNLWGQDVILHAHLTWPLYYTFFSSIGLPAKKVYTEHSTKNKRRNIKPLKKIERHIYNSFDAIIAISEGVSFSLSEWLNSNGKYRPNIQVIYNGARLFSCKYHFNKNKPLKLVSVGRLVDAKGFDVSIPAISLARDIVDKYVIVGAGNKHDDLIQLAKEANVEDKLVFMGQTDNVEAILHESDVFVLPSKWEGFGLVAVEAMSAGLPGIVNNVPGLSEVVAGDTPNIFLLNRLDAKAIAEGIRYFFDNKELFDQFSTMSRKRAELFSLKNMENKYIELYDRILS